MPDTGDMFQLMPDGGIELWLWSASTEDGDEADVFPSVDAALRHWLKKMRVRDKDHDAFIRSWKAWKAGEDDAPADVHAYGLEGCPYHAWESIRDSRAGHMDTFSLDRKVIQMHATGRVGLLTRRAELARAELTRKSVGGLDRPALALKLARHYLSQISLCADMRQLLQMDIPLSKDADGVLKQMLTRLLTSQMDDFGTTLVELPELSHADNPTPP